MEATVQPFPGLRRLERLCYVVVWIGALALLPIPQAPVQLILAFCLLIVPSLFLTLPAQRHSFYRSAWRVIMSVFIVASLAERYWSGRPLPETLVAQMCFYQVYKAYNSKSHLDYMLMALFAFLMVVLCGLVSDSVFFALILIPFVAAFVAFQQTLSITRQYLMPARNAEPQGFQVAAARLDAWESPKRRYSWAYQTGVIVLLGLLAFYLLPRKHMFNPSHFAKSSATSGRDPVTSGLSGGLSLRHFSAIKNDPTAVVKVEFQGAMPPHDKVFLRSGALDRLHNCEWYAEPRPPLNESDPDGTFWFERINPDDQSQLIAHVVTFLGQPGQAPIAMPGLVALRHVETQLPQQNLGIYRRLAWLSRYEAYSWGVDGPPARYVAPEEGSAPELTALPAEMTTGPLHELAVRMTSYCANDLQAARAVEQFLRGHYGYTLNIEPLNGPANGPNPIERFLFDVKQANCEVFASAMVLLCRNVGIPSRIAIGYHGGIDGEKPREIVFRNQDAHAWVEVWSRERGWVTFDPTPPPPLEVYHGRYQFKAIMEWFAATAAGWNRAVVWYDNDSKMKWMAWAWDPIDRLFSRSRTEDSRYSRIAARLRDNITRPQVLALLAVLVVVNAAAVGLYLETRRRLAWKRGDPTARDRDPWLRFYRAAVSALRGRMAHRRRDQTPEEFLLALAGACAVDAEALDDVIRFYYRGRFGCLGWCAETAREAHALLSALSSRIAES